MDITSKFEKKQKVIISNSHKWVNVHYLLFYFCWSSIFLMCVRIEIGLKVFRYSFFGTIPNFLNRLLDSPFLARSKWNLQYLLVLDSTLAWFTFCENRYFHDNDKQKTSKTLKLKFSAIQISLWKANTNILNCGVWHAKYTRTKKILYKSQKHFQP